MDFLGGYINLMDEIARWANTTHEMMHVHCGLALYLGMQLLLRTRRASPVALVTVVIVAILHEAVQRLHYGTWRWEDTLGDIALTTMWPAAITCVGLYRRRRWDAAHRAREAAVRLVRTDYSAHVVADLRS